MSKASFVKVEILARGMPYQYLRGSWRIGSPARLVAGGGIDCSTFLGTAGSPETSGKQ